MQQRACCGFGAVKLSSGDNVAGVCDGSGEWCLSARLYGCEFANRFVCVFYPYKKACTYRF